MRRRAGNVWRPAKREHRRFAPTSAIRFFSQWRNKIKLTRDERKAKLTTLIAAYGFATFDDLYEVAFRDSVGPAICTAPECNYTADMELDQREGYCEACGCNTVQSALILAGMI